MRVPSRRAVGIGAIALAAALVIVPSALAQSAVDQYSEGIPTAGGQESSRDAVSGQGGSAGTATIAPQTRAQLDRSSKGKAAEKAARITAPGRSSDGSEPSDSGGGLGLLLPLILVAALAGGVAIFLARRRGGPPPDQPDAGAAAG